MLNESMIASAEKAMKTGEKTRILFETLLEHLGFETLESVELKDIFDKMRQHQEEYNEAIKMLAIVMQQAKRAKQGDLFEKNGDTYVHGDYK